MKKLCNYTKVEIRNLGDDQVYSGKVVGCVCDVRGPISYLIQTDVIFPGQSYSVVSMPVSNVFEVWEYDIK